MPRPTSFLPCLALLAIAGCAGPQPQTPETRASAAAAAACRASTETSFNRQNRYLLSERDTTDAPFSTSGVTGITTRGLTQQYDYNRQLNSCLSSSNSDAAVPSVQPAPQLGTPVAPY
jgi:hypothetical protein